MQYITIIVLLAFAFHYIQSIDGQVTSRLSCIFSSSQCEATFGTESF